MSRPSARETKRAAKVTSSPAARRTKKEAAPVAKRVKSCAIRGLTPMFATSDSRRSGPSLYLGDSDSTSVRLRQTHKSGAAVTARRKSIHMFVSTEKRKKKLTKGLKGLAKEKEKITESAVRGLIARENKVRLTPRDGDYHVEVFPGRKRGKGNPHHSGGRVVLPRSGERLFDKPKRVYKKVREAEKKGKDVKRPVTLGRLWSGFPSTMHPAFPAEVSGRKATAATVAAAAAGVGRVSGPRRAPGGGVKATKKISGGRSKK